MVDRAMRKSPKSERLPEVEADIARVEASLVERGQRVAELERELERHRALVRDMVERLNTLQASATGDRGGAGTEVPRRLRDENAALTLQVTRTQERLAELEAGSTAKDGLLTRLQLELAELENTGSTGDHRMAQLREENDRLRQALLDVAEADDKAPPRIVEAWVEGRRAMKHIQALLSDLLAEEPDEVLRQTAVGIEPPAADSSTADRD